MRHLDGKTFLISGRFPGTTQRQLRRRIEAAGGRVVQRVVVGPFVSVPTFVVLGAGAGSDAYLSLQDGAAELSLPELERMLGAYTDAAVGTDDASRDPAAVTLANGFVTLAIEDGEETVLDLSTGAQFDRLVPDLIALPAFAAEQLTVSRLAEALAVGGLKSESLSDSELFVEIYDDDAVIRIDAARSWLRFQKAFTINPHVSDAKKHEIINTLQCEWEVVRFTVPAPDTLAADWVIPYNQGIAPFQIVIALQGFVATVQQALRTCADVGLLA